MIDGDFLLRAALGLGTLLVGWAGFLLSRRGQADTRLQQAAANALQTRVNTVDELESVITHVKADRDRLQDIVEKLRAENTEAAARQAERCQVQLDRLIDNVATLQSIVSDEIARESALGDVQHAQQHMADDHDRTWTDDSPGGAVRY